MNRKKAFLSYSWDSDEHREWVRKLADSLEERSDIHVVWDGYDLDSLTDKNKFMESGIAESDFILVVATEKYKLKADNRKGGVGIETYMASAAHWSAMESQGKTKILVLLREKNSVPNYISGHIFIDFTTDDKYEKSEFELLQHLRGDRRITRPPKRKNILSDDGNYTFTKF